jgi:hypothetical protein
MNARTYCYWNLHRGQWSIRYRGKVIDRRPEVTLWGVEFRVGEGGRQRVLRERRKNVHAYAAAMNVGTISARTFCDDIDGGWRQVKYNPFRAGFFYDADTGREVLRAKVVFLRDDKTVWAHKPAFGRREVTL